MSKKRDSDEPLTLENMPELCTINELAEFFRITVPTAKKYVQSDKLPQAFIMGTKWLIPKEDIINLAREMYGNKEIEWRKEKKNGN